MIKKGLIITLSALSCVAVSCAVALIPNRMSSSVFAAKRGVPRFDGNQTVDSTNFQYISSEAYVDPEDETYFSYIDNFQVVNTGSGNGFITASLWNECKAESAYTPVEGKVGTFAKDSYLILEFDRNATSLKSFVIDFEEGGDVALAGIVFWSDISNWFYVINDSVEPQEPINLIDSMHYSEHTDYTPNTLMLTFNDNTTVKSFSITYSC